MTQFAPRSRLMARQRSPLAAGFLSFLWPGLGQAFLGRRRAAILWAFPPLVIALVAVFTLLGGVDVLAANLFTPSFTLTLLVLVVLIGAWRILSIMDAAAVSLRRPTSKVIAVLAMLLVGVIGAHWVAGYYAWSFFEAGNRIFNSDGSPSAVSVPGGGNASPLPGSTPSVDNSVDFQATPEATPATAQSRVNILVTGIDSGNGRDHALTDTLMIVSIDPANKKNYMISFPRDISGFPLFNGGTYGGKINSLLTYARLHPDQFPAGGLPTLIKELGYLLGVPIHYYAAINLEGFVRIVDMVGGVTINNPKDINDPTYSWNPGGPGARGFYLSAGVHHLDGQTALAYVRSRKGIGDNDYTRAGRQQEVLQVLRKQLTTPSMILKIPDLVDAVGGMIRTNFPQDRLADMVQLAQGADSAPRQWVLGPPYSWHPDMSTTGGSWELRLDMTKLATLSVQLFGKDSRYYNK